MDVKGLKRIKSRLFSFTMLFVVGFFLSLTGSGLSKVGVVYADEPETFDEIPIDMSEHDITIPAGGKIIYFSVKPEVSTYYCIKANNSNLYIGLFDKDKNIIGSWSTGSTRYNVLENNKEYLVGFKLATSTTESLNCKVKIYAPIDSYSFKINSTKIYVKDGKVTEESYDPNLYYKASNGTIYKANCTMKYKKFSNYNSAVVEGNYIDGIPMGLGKYYISYTGIAPFSGTTSRTIYIYDESDFTQFSFSNNAPIGYSDEESFYYTQKPFDLSYISVKRNNDVMQLEKDYICEGYTTQSMYELAKDSVKWKTGTPTVPGKYVLKLTGIGNCKGTKYYNIIIRKALDMDYMVVKDVKTSNERMDIQSAAAGVYKIKPSKTGKYTVYLSREDGPIYAMIIDKKGAIIQSFLENREDLKNLSMELELSEGEDYYLYVLGYDSSYYYYLYYYGTLNTFTFTIGIPGYSFYTPPTTEEDKKTEDQKKDDKKEDKKDQQTDLGKTTEQAKTTDKKDDTKKTSDNKPLAKGKTFKSGGMTYKVTVSKKGNYQVALVKNNTKTAKKVTVKDIVKYKGTNYKITSIGSSAFTNNKKLETITLGKNIKKIGKPAFKGCAKLVKVRVPKAKLSSYKKLLKKAGLKIGVKVTYK